MTYLNMPEKWPPNGYTEPQEYSRSDRVILALGAVLAVLFGISTIQPITAGTEVYIKEWLAVALSIGFSPVTAAILGAGLAGVGFVVLFYGVVTPIHESIHYVVALLLNLNPDFGYQGTGFLKNPRVVALSTGIPVWKNMLMLIAPFLIIGLVSVSIVFVSNGLIAGVAGVVLWVNSAASSQDLYHCVRLLRMDPETKFANFEQDGEIRTEYAVPK